MDTRWLTKTGKTPAEYRTSDVSKNVQKNQHAEKATSEATEQLLRVESKGVNLGRITRPVQAT